MKLLRSPVARLLGALCSLMVHAACGPVEESLDTSENLSPAQNSDSATIEQGIKNGLFASGSFFSRSTVSLVRPNGVRYCTGTIIGPHHVLSAAHCRVNIDDIVRFYSGALPLSVQRSIKKIYTPWGVDLSQQPVSPAVPDLANWDSGLSDTNDKYADLLVLTLDSDIPAGFEPALLPSRYVGNGETSRGYLVGTGIHDGRDSSAVLKWTTSKVYSSDNNDGHLLTDSADVDDGDSGGPFYTVDTASGRLAVHGALSGTRLEWAQRAKYTSTSFHLDRILRGMGESRFPHWDFPGADYRSFATNDDKACAVACMQDRACKAYTHVAAWRTCFLKDRVPAGRPGSGMTSGLKSHTLDCASGRCGI